jgi:hypothetical protein
VLAHCLVKQNIIQVHITAVLQMPREQAKRLIVKQEMKRNETKRISRNKTKRDTRETKQDKAETKRNEMKRDKQKRSKIKQKRNETRHNRNGTKPTKSSINKKPKET